MKTLYFDCFAGASGNMILGGLIALGVSTEELTRQLKCLSTSEFGIEIEKVDRSGISATHLKVVIPEENTHRHLADIEKILRDSSLSELVKQRSIGIFTRLAEAEAKVHGIDVQKVHFHEVGAMDAIIDVVGSCIAFELIGVERFICSKIHVGSGFVEMAHGTYPVPPPAVAELLCDVPIYSTDVVGELTTPTGAAIITYLCDGYGNLPEMTVEQIAYGAGTREYESFPNVLRLILGETDLGNVTAVPRASDALTDSLVVLETNIDDISPQVLGFVMERALKIGGLDCWFTPIQMKKNRPATMLSVLCSNKTKDWIMEMLYSETTTLGIRSTNIERNSLPRETVVVKTSYGDVSVKVARYGDKIVNVMPEYEHVRKLAVENNVPFRVVHSKVLENFRG
ncbi:MAG: nickel pincer cofactor biosynthesis protein LarC, partial [Pyrinomonadaceae bacterium]